MAPKSYTLTFLGDVMLGRLIDQLMPNHVHCPSEARSASHFLKHVGSHLRSYGPKTPWGNTLPLLQSSDLLLINLETAVTTHDLKWPDKVFNYRMHPANLEILRVANVAYAGLANNHTLDFAETGLLETVQTVRQAGIAFAGAGETAEEARGPAILKLPQATKENQTELQDQQEIHVYAASDHPFDWKSLAQFNLIDYTSSTRTRLKAELTKRPPPALKIFSVHWGPNYAWHPAREIQDLAHFLIDECDVDIVHGHSSHHVQGVEVYRGKPIIYGCGDFVDDYAVTAEYRNDLSAAWRVVVEDDETKAKNKEEKRTKKLIPTRVDIYPNRIKHFQAQLLDRSDPDYDWVKETLTRLSGVLGTTVHDNLSSENRLEIAIT